MGWQGAGTLKYSGSAQLGKRSLVGSWRWSIRLSVAFESNPLVCGEGGVLRSGLGCRVAQEQGEGQQENTAGQISREEDSRLGCEWDSRED